MLNPGSILQGRIEIQERLGKGAYGAVYKAYHRPLNREVAVKELIHRSDPSFVNHFEQEAQILAKLNHSAMPSVFDSFCEDDGFYYVMDYIPGEDLSAYVERQPNKMVDEATALRFITTILDVLDYLHRQDPPVIHRDIKHANIRVTPDEHIYLVDFGIAKVYDPQEQTSTMARAVTPGFSPLEQYYSDGSTDPRTDLYAVGATLYYMLSGSVPPNAIHRAQGEGHDLLQPLSQLNPSVSPYLETIIHTLLAKHPEQRYQDVRSVKQALVQKHNETTRKELPMKDFSRITNLKAELQEVIQDRQGITETNILERLRSAGFQAISERLGSIERILQHEKYDLVFIGKRGTGKTTAICHLFNLVQTTKAERRINGKQRTIDVVRELFSTGAGNTTIGDVIIASDNTTYFKIEPYEETELKELIREFCSYNWLKVHTENTDEENAGGKIEIDPTIDRAIRNMIKPASQRTEKSFVDDVDQSSVNDSEQLSADENENIQVTVAESNIVGKGIEQPVQQRKNRSDPVVDLVKQFPSDQFESFFEAVLDLANLSERITTRIDYDGIPNDINSEKTWIRRTFESLNLGKLTGFSLPKRIFAHIQQAIFELSDYLRIGTIIDTRGIGTDLSRADLEKYIRHQNNALCIFTDLFAQAPATVSDMMKIHLTAEAYDLHTKSILMAFYRKNEPERVQGDDGIIGDLFKGIEYRKEYINQEFSGLQVKLPPNNILFYDALQCYDEHQRFNAQDYMPEDVKEQRHAVLKSIMNVLEARESLLWEEVQVLEQRYHEIQKGQGLNPQDEELIYQVREKIKGYRYQNFIVGDFINRYIESWMPKHAMRLRATNNRFGDYNDINIYTAVKPLVEQLVREILQRPKDRIFEAVQSIGKNATVDADLQPFILSFLTQIDAYYLELIDTIGSEMVAELKNQVFAPQDDSSTFWSGVIDRFGQGPGYKNDVIEMYEHQLETHDIVGCLQETAESQWKKLFINRVLHFFGE